MNPIDIKDPSEEFDKHLEQENNQRVFFSGPFGVGKTYFLKEFFKECDNYEIIHLFPVNYSVAQNEDIFELIKHDILYELLTKFGESGVFDKDEISVNLKRYFFLMNQGNIAFEYLINGISKISEKASGIFEFAKGLEKLEGLLSFEKYGEGIESNEGETLKYLKKFHERQGSICESDFNTQLIQELITKLKESSQKETALIIDDLDRIDPEHIFRILNVFSAHFDINQSGNKFGFDKIIVVAHYENIQSIFQHKYGIYADFNGYVDKFYSLEAFRYDNRKAINYWIEENHVHQNDSSFLTNILLNLVLSQQLSLRQLFKIRPGTAIGTRHEIPYLKFYLQLLRLMYGGNTETVIQKVRNIGSILPQKIFETGSVNHYMEVFILPPLVNSHFRKKDEGVINGNPTYSLVITHLQIDLPLAQLDNTNERFKIENKDYQKLPFWDLLAESIQIVSKEQ